MTDPPQGEAGIIIPADDYLAKAHAACQRHKALFIADEVQTGLCRTGRMLAVDHGTRLSCICRVLRVKFIMFS